MIKSKFHLPTIDGHCSKYYQTLLLHLLALLLIFRPDYPLFALIGQVNVGNSFIGGILQMTIGAFGIFFGVQSKIPFQ